MYCCVLLTRRNRILLFGAIACLVVGPLTYKAYVLLLALLLRAIVVPRPFVTNLAARYS